MDMDSLKLFLLLLSQTFAFPNLGIHGGLPVKLGQYPYQVAIRECHDPDDEIFHGYCILRCSGTLISPTWVLTSAYCLEEYLHKMNIVVGTLNVTNISQTAQNIDVKRSLKHPDYGKEQWMSANNIGLIELAKPVLINQYANIAKLPSSKTEPTGELVISGWGEYKTIEHNRVILFPDNLLAAEVQIPSNIQECFNDFNKNSFFPLTSSPEKYICTRPKNLKETINVCWGDTGGPLAKDGTVYGVALFGFGKCNLPGAPEMHIKVANYLEWIAKYVKDI